MYYVELEPIFNNEGSVLPIDFVLDLSDCEFNGGFPFGTVRVLGEVKNSTGIVSLAAKAEFTLNLTCDRCAAEFSRAFSVPVEHVLVTEVNDDGNDEFIVIDSFHYDIEPLIREDVFLYMPFKVLCREDCLGICLRCGKNLNEGSCNCVKEYDHRWDALSALLGEDS